MRPETCDGGGERHEKDTSVLESGKNFLGGFAHCWGCGVLPVRLLFCYSLAVAAVAATKRLSGFSSFFFSLPFFVPRYSVSAMICSLLLFELPCSAEHVLLPVPPFVARQARPLSIEASIGCARACVLCACAANGETCSAYLYYVWSSI